MQTFINRYKYLTNLIGNFWGIYLFGIYNLYNIKANLCKTFIIILIQFVSSYYVNQIILSDSSIDHSQIYNLLIIFGVCQILSPFTTFIFDDVIATEKIKISERICSFVDMLYIKSSYEWKIKNPNYAQKESLTQLFAAYENMSYMLSDTIQSCIDIVIMMVITCMTNIYLGIYILIASIILYLSKKKLNKKLTQYDKDMSGKIIDISMIISNQYINRGDIIFSPSYLKLFVPTQYNPINGFMKESEIWNKREIINKKSMAIVDMLKTIIIVLFAFLLLYQNKVKLVVFMIVNNYRIISFLNFINDMDGVKNLAEGRVANSFIMIQSAINDNFNNVNNVNLNNVNNLNNINNIDIYDIEKKITDTISLKYSGIIQIRLMKGIILFNGKKGSGKTLTMDIIAGLYDDKISNKIIINKTDVLPNEFRDLMNYRVYVRQCICDDYRANKKNTITLTLGELFPDGSYTEIFYFLSNFDMSHKIPKDITKHVSDDERGLSPGETQSIVLASQIWKALKLKTKILLLDEPERNIDLDTVKKIFNMLNTCFDGTIFLITHLPDLKDFLDSRLIQVWNYRQNIGGDLTFTIEDKNYK